VGMLGIFFFGGEEFIFVGNYNVCLLSLMVMQSV